MASKLIGKAKVRETNFSHTAGMAVGIGLAETSDTGWFVGPMGGGSSGGQHSVTNNLNLTSDLNKRPHLCLLRSQIGFPFLVSSAPPALRLRRVLGRGAVQFDFDFVALRKAQFDAAATAVQVRAAVRAVPSLQLLA
jgi:hypothetical protein